LPILRDQTNRRHKKNQLMVGPSFGLYVVGKSWASHRFVIRAFEKAQDIAQELIECYNSRAAVLRLMNVKHSASPQ